MRQVLTSKDLADIQQPLDKDGWSSSRFDELYGKNKNPYKGSERDRKNRKDIVLPAAGAYRRGWLRIFGKQ